MVFSEITCGVEEFFRHDRCLQLYLAFIIEDGFTTRPSGIILQLQGIVERFVRSFQAGIATLEECSHVRRHQGIGEALVSVLAFHVAQIDSAGGIEVRNALLRRQRTDTRLPDRVFKGDESHRNAAAKRATWVLEVY